MHGGFSAHKSLELIWKSAVSYNNSCLYIHVASYVSAHYRVCGFYHFMPNGARRVAIVNICACYSYCECLAT